jgi:hypothetical protein
VGVEKKRMSSGEIEGVRMKMVSGELKVCGVRWDVWRLEGFRDDPVQRDRDKTHRGVQGFNRMSWRQRGFKPRGMGLRGEPVGRTVERAGFRVTTSPCPCATLVTTGWHVIWVIYFRQPHYEV